MVAIVGYTNAGKSTLLNALTDAGVLAENRLFATLDTRARRLHLLSGHDVILTDTVGFIREMPKDLFATFRATFEEARDADLLLEVIDAADPEHDEHLRTTEKLVQELGLSEILRLRIYNKVDLLSPSEQQALEREPDAVAISALRKETLVRLLQRIASELTRAGRLVGPLPAGVASEPMPTAD